MRLLDRYVLRELLTPFLIGTVSVVLMFLANTLIFYAPQVFSKDMPLSAVGQYLFFKIPQTLNMTLPVGITIASSLAVSRLARESEMTAMRAAGISIKRIMLPMIALGAAVGIFSFYLTEAVTPKAEDRATRTLRKIFASAEAIGLQSNVLLELNRGEYHASIGTVSKGAGGNVEMRDVLVFQKPKRGVDWFVQSPTATYDDGILTFENPRIWIVEGERLIVETPKKWQINVRMSLEDFFGQKLPSAMSASELRKSIDAAKSRGESTKVLEVDYQNKFAVPAACLVFALFSPAFSLFFTRGGAFMGVLVSIIVVFLYYNIWVLSSQVLAKQWILPPFIGAWLPNVLFFGAGAFALWRAE